MVTIQTDQFSSIIHLWFHKQCRKCCSGYHCLFKKCILNAQLQNQCKCSSKKASCSATPRTSSVSQQKQVCKSKQPVKEDLLSLFRTFKKKIPHHSSADKAAKPLWSTTTELMTSFTDFCCEAKKIDKVIRHTNELCQADIPSITALGVWGITLPPCTPREVATIY